jgi:gliding motility-associated-like protein
MQPFCFFVGLLNEKKHPIMKNYMLKITFTALFSLITVASWGQLIINPNGTITPVQAVEDILIGAGINAFNIQYNPSIGGNANAVQPSVMEFSSGATAFPISSGVLMTTASGAGNLNDPDLNAITGGSATNGSIIEFDFIPTGDTLSFNYIFASLEYTQYTCSNFNDAFGFFISGPGISGPYSNNAINIATVPGTNVPVAINTVNSGTPSGFNSSATCSAADPNWQANSIYFTTSYNTIFSNTPGLPAFNGATVVLAANASLECNVVYHIKMAIANDLDTALDSGVFLEANSFSSDVVDINIQAGASISDTTLIANCTEGTIYFTRPASQANDTLIIYFQTSGDAIEGTDYNFLAPGDSIIFLPGQDTVTLTITPTNGGSSSNPFSLIVNAQTINACGDTIFAEGIVWLLLEPDFVTMATDTTILCKDSSVTIWGSVTGGFPPYSYEWDDGQIGTPIQVPVDGENGPYYFTFTATDQCGFEVTDTAIVNLNQTLSIDTLIQMPSECGLATGTVFSQWSEQGSVNPTFSHLWTTGYSTYDPIINASVAENLPSGWYVYTVSSNVTGCSVTDSIFLEQDPPPTAAFTPNPAEGNAPLDVTFINNSSGGSSYVWDFDNGLGASNPTASNENTIYTEEGVYVVQLIVTEGACADTAYQTVIVNLILPLTFNTPNIFTPNNDGSNDVFTLNGENVVALELVVLNRWGNVVFESTEIDAAWNGKNNNTGNECSEGVYFYKYVITGQGDQGAEGHGFVHLVRGN